MSERPPSSSPGEFDLIRRLRDRTPAGPPGALGIGDDAAVLGLSEGSRLVVTTDMLMDGRHFDLATQGAEAAGFKAMAVNLSDLAAMAARPVGAVVAVALPKAGGKAVEVATALHAGLVAASSRFGVAILGGDTNGWDGPLVISVAAFGETTLKGEVRRSGARPGDLVCVTGPLGGSFLGRHLTPAPRVLEALALNDALTLHAMIDVSDGLAADLGHILEESGNSGAILDASAVPIHADALAMSRLDGRPPLDHALHDGEDFELCVVLPPAELSRWERMGAAAATLIPIGEIVEGGGLRVREPSGRVREVGPGGFDHLAD